MSKIRTTFTVLNDKGLHTRPSTELVRCATKFQSEIELSHSGTTVNAKSLLGILMLAASKGTQIEVSAAGPDAQEALEAILALAGEKFHMDY